MMRSLLDALLGYFLTPTGLIVLGALDSSLIFFLPLGIDIVIIVLTARSPEMFWLYALLATTGSIIGASITFWLGRKVGEHGLSRLVNPSRLKRIEDRVSKGAVLIGALGMIPPPFPFTAFVLTGGALRVNAWSFLTALAVGRVVRFGVESALAARYGKQILAWMESTAFEVTVAVLIVLAVVGTIVSAVAMVRSTRRRTAQPAWQKVQQRNLPKT